MGDSILSFEEFSFNEVQDQLNSKPVSFESVKVGNEGEQMRSYGGEGWGEMVSIDSLCSDDGFYWNGPSGEGLVLSQHQQHEQQQQSFLDYRVVGDLSSDILSLPLQDVRESNEKRNPVSSSSLGLMKDYGNVFKQLLGERRMIEPSNCTPCAEVAGQELSTEEIMRIAGARFIQSHIVDVSSRLNNPNGLSFSGLSDEEAKKVQLGELLLASAEKVSNQQFDSARRLLYLCDCLSSNTGNTVQRVVYYFSKALRERIDRGTGRITSLDLRKMQSFDIDEAVKAPTPNILACHQEVPFSQVSQFAGIQAIVENVAKAKRIHVIDLQIRYGVQWTVLMQALASQYNCPVQLLKITAVATTSKQLIMDAGNRLRSFAETINLPFSFKIVMVSDLLDLKEELFEVDADERVAVYSEYLLRSLISLPDRLHSMMRVIRNLDPCIMVVAEVEANLNSPVFVNRFIEALFFFSAYFDCFDACMKQDEPNRMILESMNFSEGLRNIVATEGEERKIRNVKIAVWRAFFTHFGMEETELSTSSLFQAHLLVKKYACAGSCTLDMDGRALLIGWKGTPMHSLSAWKFIRQD